ncbi:hypothetical protein ESOMN_v1c01100 [Williamsoniiplasma somnilux]|uniref:Uncharacterized protein n=1 Tax=Williamsoniiplasma somnilux TaxID=215578 RepID=A0A2K8NXC6_9MOLU|nr:hypothetical protein [Williamsoniiplasma somnilux]ATZ18495.1 hypothetical protein ESOMN_v1c01100 [Williamsoniiplasma somnilux]
MFNLQKYFIKIIDDTFKQIKMNVNFDLSEEATSFFKKNHRITNFAQSVEFNNLVLKPLKILLNNNQLIYSNEFKLASKKWVSDYECCIIVLNKFHEHFVNLIVNKEDNTFIKLKSINEFLFNNFVVKMYGEYHLDFLKMDLEVITSKIVQVFDENNLEILNLNQLLSLESDLLQKIILSLKNAQISDDNIKNEFLSKLYHFKNLCAILLSLTYKILIEFNYPEINKNIAYIYIK